MAKRVGMTFNGMTDNTIANADHLATYSLSISTKAGRPIVTDLSLSISPGMKIAIIGSEGAGKTTLMRAFAGVLDLGDYNVSGKINRGKVGFLEQTPDARWEKQTPLEYLLKDHPDQDINGKDAHLWGRYGAAVSALVEVNLSQKLLEDDRHFETLSGGENVRLRIAKLLVHDPDVVLLDEPTNNLDIKSLEWLESYIAGTPRGIAFITHDETLVERCSKQLLFMQYMKNPANIARHVYVGVSYPEFLEINERSIQESEKLADKQEKRERQLRTRVADAEKSVINRTRAGLKRAEGMAQKNRVDSASAKGAGLVKRLGKELERLSSRGVVVIARQHPISIDFDQGCYLPSGKIVVDLNSVELGYASRICARDVSLRIVGPKKVVITGRNGVGKTTLLKKIYDIAQGCPGIRLGYVPQNTQDLLEYPQKPAVEYLDDVNPDMTRNRSTLMDFGFEREELTSPVGELSGGQRTKLLIASAVLSKSNVLLLDEPTNNLSPLTAPPLRQAIKDFPGAVVVVTHDRKLIQGFGGVVLELRETGLVPTIIPEAIETLDTPHSNKLKLD